tara:strand:+ start:2392 stop:2601 length:210 start_codon:yes stop_codon:yes gene_type:complete
MGFTNNDGLVVKLFQIFLDGIDSCPIQRKAKALAESHILAANPIIKGATKAQIERMRAGETIKASELLL